MKVNEIAPIGLAFILIAVILGVGGMILGQISPHTLQATTTSENFSFVNGDSNTTAYYPIRDVSVVNASNLSQAFTSPADYNVTLSNGTFVWGIGVGTNVTTAQVTYTYDANTNATATVNQGSSSLKDLSSWLPIIAVVVAAIIIIGIILGGFGRGQV